MCENRDLITESGGHTSRSITTHVSVLDKVAILSGKGRERSVFAEEVAVAVGAFLFMGTIRIDDDNLTVHLPIALRIDGAPIIEDFP